MMMSPEEQKTGLEHLLDLIRQKTDESGNWTLTDKQIAGTLGLSPADFYTKIYNHENPLVSAALDKINQEETGLLITLLEALGFNAAEKMFWERGYFIPYDKGTDIEETVISLLAWKVRNHSFYYREFLDMLRHFRSVRKPLELYIDQFFPIQPILEEAADDFLMRNPETDPLTGWYTVLRYLKMLEQRKILVPRDFLYPLWEPLIAFAKSEGFEPEWIRERPEPSGGQSRTDPRTRAIEERQGALRIFGFSSEFTKEDLKIRYKQLMKQYHPDINPSGLKKSQEINAAYAELIRIAG